jgi:hypothetical protein
MEINLKLSNTNSAKRFVITGFYDSKLRPIMEEVKWSEAPEILPDNDTYAKMSPEETVGAFLDAYSRQDWDKMRKFAPNSFVEELKGDFGNTAENPPSFEIKGKALWSAEQSAYLVKCRIEGGVKKWNLAIRNDNPANRYMFDGGI